MCDLVWFFKIGSHMHMHEATMLQDLIINLLVNAFNFSLLTPVLESVTSISVVMGKIPIGLVSAGSYKLG